MNEAGIPVKDLIIPCGITIDEKMDKLIRTTLGCRKNFDAIFTYNDIIAFRIIRIARQMNMVAPDIIGYDNIQSKIDFGFDIPSVNIYKTLMAEKATAWLFSRIRHEIKPEEHLNEMVPVDLHVKTN
jgi:DNA-binding LacI/PurR family transcriptional regulator